MSSKTSLIHYSLSIQDNDDSKITFEVIDDKLGITSYYDSCLGENYYILNKSDFNNLIHYLQSISDQVKDDKEEKESS